MSLLDIVTNPIFVICAGAGVVIFFATVLFAGYTLFSPQRTATDRLSEYTGKDKEKERDPAMEAIAERLGKLAQPQDEEERNLLRLRLIQAGYRDPRALELFNAIRVVVAILLPILVAPLLVAWGSWVVVGIGVVAMGGIGYIVPGMIVSSRLQQRQKKLLAPFADALDLLVISVEAGLGVDAAFRRVADEIGPAAPELASEFQLVNHEISAGVNRIDALKHLATRTGLDEVKSLVNMLSQAERFGTSIARSLRVHADLTRAKRMTRAEEEAAKVSPKLTVIMILFLMPSLIVVLLGPAFIRIKNELWT
jgi:tight adherence protein C